MPRHLPMGSIWPRTAKSGAGVADDNLVNRVGRLAGRAARTTYTVGKRLPGADSAERGLRSAERMVLGELRRRLDAVDDPYQAALSQASAMTRHGDNGSGAHGSAGSGEIPDTVTVLPAERDAEPLRAAMAELLNHSIGFGVDRAREYLYAVMLRQLTPDEARIIAALADGSPFPAVDIAERAAFGGTGRIALRNASTVGKQAGVSLLDHVPSYVSRLIGLGLIERDEEVPAMETQYEILLTDSTVRAAEESLRRPKAIRHTVHISPLGVQFWQACDPAGGHVNR